MFLNKKIKFKLKNYPFNYLKINKIKVVINYTIVT